MGRGRGRRDSPPRSASPDSGHAACSAFTRWTVPTPTPTFRAAALIPVPLASSRRIAFSVAWSTRGRPRIFPCAFASLETRTDALHEHGSFELREDSDHLKEHPPRRRAGVETLLVEVQVNVLRFQLVEEPEEVSERTPQLCLRAPACGAGGPLGGQRLRMTDCVTGIPATRGATAAGAC